MPGYTNSAHAEQLVNHWYWRPGWEPGREFYTWHLTFEDEHELHRLVAEYQDALRGVQELDMVPISWLHVTMQGVGFADEVAEAELAALADAVGRRVAAVPPQVVTFDRPTARPQAIALYPSPARQIQKIRTAVRTGFADLWGERRVPEAEAPFTPHLSVAYVNSDTSSRRAVQAVTAVVTRPVAVTIRRITLIALAREGHLYRWRTIYRAPLLGGLRD
ncbi:2'-5' RNA ligase family protein [Lentzea alba]|uniref:2'-5' RNA ligase family protein n=1 Tax=Lentzea alba TaxID=2714351 RepID=UPI0039BF45A4